MGCIIGWWGIKFDIKKNTLKIKSFIENLDNNHELTKEQFKVISSLSKISSFVNIKDYVVYDSRVSFAMNWLLFKQENPDNYYFPMPDSRSAVIKDIALFLKSKIKFKYGLNKFYSPPIAYQKFNELIKNLSEEVFIDDLKRKEYPFFLEMLIFEISIKEIYQEILKHKNDLEIIN